jgi:hypothetical protein
MSVKKCQSESFINTRRYFGGEIYFIGIFKEEPLNIGVKNKSMREDILVDTITK